MLTYVWRQELVPLLAIDPVLHYYPLMACYQELRAPVTAWKDSDGSIRGALIPCDPPGRAWVLASSNEMVLALMEEVPPEATVTLPLWADTLVKSAAPRRTLSTEVLAVCTPGSLRIPETHVGLTMAPLDAVGEDEDTAAVLTAPLRVAHLGCIIGGSLAGFCTYRIDGRGGGSIERLVISKEWMSADIGKTIMAAAAATILEEAERVVFAAAGDNQGVLGAARTVGFRTCYWLRSASPERTTVTD